ncbi:MAG TPA: phosphotransferase [Natronosporangium sp.]|jgi:hypothetical protein
MPASPPPVPYHATAVRPRWPDLPADLRSAIERRLGSPVVNAATAGGGFTRGFAALVRTASGDRAFVKAASLEHQPHLVDWYVREAAVTDALPAGVPAPRTRWTLTVAGWFVSCLEAVEGRMPVLPWRPDDLAAALAAYAATAAALREPPDELLALGIPKLSDVARTDLSWWREVAEGREELPPVPPYVRERLADLVALEGWLPHHTAGHGVIHGDLRLDNIIIDLRGSAWICDWTWPCLGPAWFDLVQLLITAYASGLDADAVLAAHPAARDAPPDGLDAALAALSGYWLTGSVAPAGDVSPHLRQHQRWSGETALGWLARRRGWI